MKFRKYHSSKILIILLLLSLFLIPNKVYAVKEPTSNFYVNDYANVLSEELETYIMNKSVALYNADKTQIVVSVVDSLEGLSIEDYALDMFRSFGIGDKEKNNGILLLLSIADRKVRIEVGYGLEGVINDGKAGRIIDNHMISYLADNNWEDGIKNGYDAIFAEIVYQNGLELEYDASYLDSDSSNAGHISGSGIYVILFILFFVAVYFNAFFGIFLRKRKYKKIAIAYLIFLIILTLLSGVFFIQLFIFVKAYFNIKSSSSGRGSSRGGSSWGGSSGGGSSFSGGGGSSGGGGASRGF